MKATLHTDGGARGNPGPAGIGYVLGIAGKPPIVHGEYIGHATNNQAEYKAFIAGLKRARAEHVSELDCLLDSELVVKQLQGEYKVKNVDLKPLVRQAQELIEQFARITFSHIPRAKNARADALVNKAIDEKQK